MLPSHLQSTGDCRLPPNLGHAPPIGITGVLCDSHTIPIGNRGRLHYTVFRPRHLTYKPPLICVAGGPFLPSQYLTPLVHLVTDRSIVVYDTIGCGQSPREGPPASESATEVVNHMIEDLSTLVKVLGCTEYHVFGHSFGGLVVYEYLRRQGHDNKQCRSAILASTPASVAGCEHQCAELLQQIREELGELDADRATEVFRKRYECRVDPIPLPLHQSLQMAGFSSSATGLRMVRDYAVETECPAHFPPTLVLRGQYDFVTNDDCQTWAKRIGSQSTCITVAGCAHYGMVENEDLFGGVLTSHLQQHDPPAKPLVFPNWGKT